MKKHSEEGISSVKGEDKEVRVRLNKLVNGGEGTSVSGNVATKLLSSSVRVNSEFTFFLNSDCILFLNTEGNLSLTEEEKNVLEHTSYVNSKIFVPFTSVDLQDKFVFPVPFTDQVSFKCSNVRNQN